MKNDEQPSLLTRLVFLEKLIQQAIEEFEDETDETLTAVRLHRQAARLRVHATLAEDQDAA